jgi:hypothetical protein
MHKPKKWLGKADKCDICGQPLNRYAHFYDGATSTGPWALMCESCHFWHGKGTGVGYGQKYRTTDKVKVAG